MTCVWCIMCAHNTCARIMRMDGWAGWRCAAVFLCRRACKVQCEHTAHDDIVSQHSHAIMNGNVGTIMWRCVAMRTLSKQLRRRHRCCEYCVIIRTVREWLWGAMSHNQHVGQYDVGMTPLLAIICMKLFHFILNFLGIWVKCRQFDILVNIFLVFTMETNNFVLIHCLWIGKIRSKFPKFWLVSNETVVQLNIQK